MHGAEASVLLRFFAKVLSARRSAGYRANEIDSRSAVRPRRPRRPSRSRGLDVKFLEYNQRYEMRAATGGYNVRLLLAAQPLGAPRLAAQPRDISSRTQLRAA